MMVQQTNTTTSRRRQLPVAVWVGLVGTLLVALLEVVRNPTASRNYVRRRLSGVPESSTFKFDGSSSDLAQQFYHRHVAGDTADPIKIDHDDLPDRIRQRLDDENLRFDKLPPLLQRALVWDSGFAMDPGPTPALVQIHTVDGVPMSDIAVPVDDFRNFGCTTSNCSDPNGMAAFRSKNCTGDQMLPSVRCASDAMTYKYTHTSMWATGGSDSIIPDFTVLRHGWTDPVNNTDYVVYAIHTTPVENEPSWDKCPSRNQYSTLIIPCDVFASSHIPKNWQLPAFGAIVVPWIKEIKASDRRRQILMYAILPLGVVVAFGLIAGAFLIAYSRRHPESGVRKWWTCGRGRSGLRSKSHTILTGSSSLQHTLLTPPPPHPPKRTSTASSSSPPPLNGPLSAPFPLPRTSSTSSMLSSPPPAPLRPRRPSSSLSEDTANMATTDRMVHILINDPHMCDKRLALERIHFQTLLSKGAFGEVWLCALDGHKVAVKRLLSSHRAVLEDVEAFTDEIQIMAALHHPHIPKFLGVAWTTLDQLCMVTEYMDGGDLQSFLKTNGHLLNWPQQKKTIALGIAKALMYLHSRAPVLIHRDIKSRNILVKEQPTLTAKVTDFGVTRSVQQRRECMMTLGVGTPYWTAPEVLDGTSYTEKSDIYSFGVVLSEIDTCQSPYHDVQYGSDSGIHLQPFHILKMVMAGTIQPRFSATCPMAVRELATKCLTFNPASRPTARELVTALEQMQWDQE